MVQRTIRLAVSVAPHNGRYAAVEKRLEKQQPQRISHKNQAEFRAPPQSSPYS
jgi:hypothetical protein